MRVPALVWWIALCLPTPVLATVPPQASLFLTADELAARAAPAPGRTTLEALVYYDPQQWRFWLNGQVVAPDHIPRDLIIHHVTSESVTITQRVGDKSAQFTLRPHQTYHWSSGLIE